MPPIYSFKVNREFLPVFVEFAASSAFVSWFSSWRKQSETALALSRDQLQMRVEERTAELKQTNDLLLAEIAERRRAQDAYCEAQAEVARVTRMSALGALAASISHEVNQPLAAVGRQRRCLYDVAFERSAQSGRSTPGRGLYRATGYQSQ
jgi:C4-dicarboxylate-specific signal transduction histidine kinase